MALRFGEPRLCGRKHRLESRMFADRVARVRPGWELGKADAKIAAEIVQRLDGLPLASHGLSIWKDEHEARC